MITMMNIMYVQAYYSTVTVWQCR